MIKLLLKVVVVLVLLVLTYNYFFGTPEEKEASRQVVAQVHALSINVVNLIKSEKEKFDEGKYADALSKLKTAIGIERERAKALGEDGKESLAKAESLSRQEIDLENKLSEITKLPEEEKLSAIESIRQNILRLTSDAESLANELER